MTALAKPTNGSNADYAARLGALIDAFNIRSVDPTSITYSASMTPDASAGYLQKIIVTNGTAFTINAPTNPSAYQQIELRIFNTFGGAMGAVTWNAIFKMAAWTNPASGFNRSIRFYYESIGATWSELSRTTVDIPN